MEFDILSKQLKELGKRISTLKDSITTEEATKTSFVMPFFQILGYDIFNPLEFVPEYTADVGIKKGEKVDYAILLNDEPAVLIEAKSISEKLTKHDSQLFRYFGTTSSKLGILTNGKEYRFYTDLDEPNKMDSTPFLTIDITKLRETQINELSKFHKNSFDIESITSSASELKYLNNLKTFLSEQFEKPSEAFTRYIVSEIYDGVKTKNTIDKFQPIVKKGLSQFVTERVNDKLSAALNTSVDTKISEPNTEISNEKDNKIDSEIVTTPEELEAYTTIKLLLKDVVTPTRIYYRDNKSYFNILLDDNIRKWIVRIYVFNGQTKIKVVLNNVEKESFEVETALDIANYSDKIISVVNAFLS